MTPERLSTIRTDVQQSILRHPAEPYFPLMGAILAARADDTNPLPWIERALERGAVNGPAHLLLAQVLSRHGAMRQGLLEYRLAYHDDPALAWEVATQVIARAPSFDGLLIAVPDGTEGAGLLEIMGALLAAPSQAELRGRCDRETILRNPRAVAPRVREADLRLRAMAKGSTSTLCTDRARCKAEVLELADSIAAIEPELSTATTLRARLLELDDKPIEAARMLSKLCDDVADWLNCLQARVSLAAQVGGPEPFSSAAKDLLGAGCSTPDIVCRHRNLFWPSCARSGVSGAWRSRFTLVRRARTRQNEARWLRLANAAAQAGAHAQAVEALETVSRQRGGSDAELRKRIDAERSLALSPVCSTLTPASL